MSQPEQSESIFYHVPVELIDALKKYRTRNSKFVLRYRYRDPIPGIQYDPYGGVLEKHAQTASIYLRNATTDKEVQRILGRHWLETEELRGSISKLQAQAVSDGKLISSFHEEIERKSESLVAISCSLQQAKFALERCREANRDQRKKWLCLRYWLPVRILLKLYWVLTGKEYDREY